MAPWAVNDQLSYGFAAVTSNSYDTCGRCYQLDFTGVSESAPNDLGSASLRNKTIIVQATNIGSDVETHQFDILVPGGGVGMFDACSQQWNAGGQLEEQFGGFLSYCKNVEEGFNQPLDVYKECVMNHCRQVFDTPGEQELLAACEWFTGWYNVADNPNVSYREVECPDEIVAVSGTDRGGNNLEPPGTGC